MPKRKSTSHVTAAIRRELSGPAVSPLPPVLAAIAAGRDHLLTEEFAMATNRASQTIRKNYCIKGECFGIRPLKFGNRLLWPVHQIAALLKGDATGKDAFARLPSKAAAPIDIQLIRGSRFYGLEVGKATRLLEGIITDHECSSVRENARLLLNGIKQGREIFDEYPLICERGRQEQSPPIYIHDAILSEIENLIKTAYRAKGGLDD